MDIGVVMPTHGLLTRDERDFFLQRIEPDQVRAFEFASLAEKLGFHSLWFSDHVVMGRDLEMLYPANLSGTKAYPERPTMFDMVAVMGGLCAVTETIRFAPSVHIAPYRHPLVTAHQFATIDQLSGGRLIFGVGPGWERQEFAALDAQFERKGAWTEEAVAVYKAAWTEDFISFEGEFFSIQNVSMEPKPLQKPYPMIVWGATSELGARRAVRAADGIYTTHLDPYPGTRVWRSAKEAALAEAAKIGKDVSNFWYGTFASALVCDADDPLAAGDRRPTLTGTAEQILEDLAEYADEGYCHVTIHPHVRSGTIDEFFEIVERFAEEVVPEARKIVAKPFGLTVEGELDHRMPSSSGQTRVDLERNGPGAAGTIVPTAQRPTAGRAESHEGQECPAARSATGGERIACELSGARRSAGRPLLLDPNCRCDCAERGHHGKPLLLALFLRLQETHPVASFLRGKVGVSSARLPAEQIFAS